MSKLLDDLQELVDAAVISAEDAARIKIHVENKRIKSGSRLYIIYGMLGSILIGSGVLLIVAHNWDDFDKWIKLMLGFVPLLLAQIICFIVVRKKAESIPWRESGASFLMLSVAVSISVVSQVYNIGGNLSAFILIWMLLSLPLIYTLQSSMVSLLFFAGITWYATEVSYSYRYPLHHPVAYYYWILLALGLPYYFGLLKNYTKSNFTYFHHWMVAGSVLVCLDMFGDGASKLITPAYMILCGLFVLVGGSPKFRELKPIANAYRVVGSGGIMIIMIICSFSFFWKGLNSASWDWFLSREWLVLLALLACSSFLIVKWITSGEKNNFLSYTPFLFIAIFAIGIWQGRVAMVLTNSLVLFIGIIAIRRGALQNNLGFMNYGLLLITTLIVCRFFDFDLSFTVRGVVFILVGIGFFVGNWQVAKTRKKTPT